MENNRLFIETYRLQEEFEPTVPDDEITLYRPDREEDIKRLLSYSIGCVMGRYSLDKPGLIYAHSANEGFEPTQYKTFRADDDGIIPLLEADWGISDDAANRTFEFVSVAWPKEHLDENLKFIADSLSPSNGEQLKDTIRRYLATGFYKHHLSMYKKRPIYWLFSSGKQRAFQCLVYLHRYNEGTLARMRTEYVIPLMGKMTARLEHLQGPPEQKGSGGEIAATSAVTVKRKLEKERDNIKKQLAELQTFDEKLRHYADLRIKLDLDDGVKVNYGKFSDPEIGDILAEVKAICGTKDED
jgi:type II restriction/modification system DNA methylase subunit YeeA